MPKRKRVIREKVAVRGRARNTKEAILMVRIGAVVGILFCTAFLVSTIIALSDI